jgi:hypothetical protein
MPFWLYGKILDYLGNYGNFMEIMERNSLVNHKKQKISVAKFQRLLSFSALVFPNQIQSLNDKLPSR